MAPSTLKVACHKMPPLDSLDEVDRILELSEQFVPPTLGKRKKARKLACDFSPYADPLVLGRLRPLNSGPPVKKLPKLSPREVIGAKTKPKKVAYSIEANAWGPPRKGNRVDGDFSRELQHREVCSGGGELGKRNVLLPYLDDLTQADMRLAEHQASILKGTNDPAACHDYVVPVWDEIKARDDSKEAPGMRRDSTVDETRGVLHSTLARRELLDEPTDVDFMGRCADELFERYLQTTEDEEAKKLGLAKVESPQSEVESLCKQFPRFCEILRLDELGTAVSADLHINHGPAWFARTIEELYDNLTTAYAASGPGVTRDSPCIPSRAPRAPEVAAAFFWRKLGTHAPVSALSLVCEVTRASLGGCADASLFKSFLSERLSSESLAVVLYARAYIETTYSLSLRRVKKRVLTKANGHTGQHGTLPRREEAPLVAPHTTFSANSLRAAQSPLYDPSILTVLLPRAAVEKLARYLVGGRRGAERAITDEVGARGLSARKNERCLDEQTSQVRASWHATDYATAPNSMAAALVRMLERTHLEKADCISELFTKAPKAAVPAFPAVADDDGLRHQTDYAEIGTIIQSLAAVVENAPDDLTAFIKYDDNGEGSTMLDTLKATLHDANATDELATSVENAVHDLAEANATLHKATGRLARLERQCSEHVKNAMTTMRAKTSVLIAEGEVARAQTVLSERHAQLSALERRIESVWDTLQKATSTCDPLGNKNDTVSPPVAGALRILRASVARESISRASQVYKCDREGPLEPLLFEGDPLESLQDPLSVFKEFKMSRHTLEDHEAILEPLVRLQEQSASRLQTWAKRCVKRKRAEPYETSLVTLVGQRNEIRFVQVTKRKREDHDERVAASRDLAQALRVRRADRDAVHALARTESMLVAKLREDEVTRLVVCKQRHSLRAHYRAWSALQLARAFSLGHGGRLLRTLLASWHRKAKKLAQARAAATGIQCAWRRCVACAATGYRRWLENRRFNMAMACYGRASDRRLHRILVEWHRWAKLIVSSREMACALQKRLLHRAVGQWSVWAKLGRPRRQHAARLLQRAVRVVRAVCAANLRIKQTVYAATILAALWRGHCARCSVYAFREDLRRKVFELQRKRAIFDLSCRIAKRTQRSIFTAWHRIAKFRVVAFVRGRKRKLRVALHAWNQQIVERIAARARQFAASEHLLRRVVHGYVTRFRFLKLLRPHRAARLIQASLVRPLFANARVVAMRELRDAIVFTQRWRRGTLGRRRARAENMERLLVAAYIDDSDALIRRHTAAVTLHALASTNAAVVRHKANGDLAIHRAARGLSVNGVKTCLTMLGIGADWSNDVGSAPLHVIGEVLDPPIAALQEIAEKKRKRQEEVEMFSGIGASLMSSKISGSSASPNSWATSNHVSSEVETGHNGYHGPSNKVDESSPIVTSDIFKEWFKENPETTNVLTIGCSQATGNDDAESLACSISSDASEQEAHFASLSAAELEEFLAQDTRHVDIVDLLLSHGAGLEAPDALGRTPLMRAIERGNVALVNTLLDKGAQPNATDYACNTPLTLAAQFGYVTIGRMLLRAGADSSYQGHKGRTALHEVCLRAQRGYAPRFARALLAAGGTLDVCDELGRTPFAYCVSCRQLDKQRADDLKKQVDGLFLGTPEQIMLRLLLDHGVDPSETYEDGATVLHLAARANRVDAVSAIIDFGDVDVSAKDALGETPLHIAARAGASHTLQALLRRGSDLYACDTQGYQPIHAACRGGHIETIETLVAYDAPLGCRSWSGLTPLGVARMYSKHKVIQYLLNTIASSSLGVVGDEPESADIVSAWSRPVAVPASKWIQEWSGTEGLSDAQWRNTETGEVRLLPPPDRAARVTQLCQAAWPETVLKRELVVVKKDDAEVTVGSAEYEQERSEHELQVVQMRREHEAAIVMQTRWRRLDAILLAAFHRERRDAARILQRFVRWMLAEKKRVFVELRFRGAAEIQRLFRGRETRLDWENFLWEKLWWRRAELQLAKQLQRLWQGYVTRRFLKRTRIRANGPRTYHDWQAVLRASGQPHRVFGIYEECFFPRSLSNSHSSESSVHRDVKFYHNRITGVCAWDQPSDWTAVDREAFEDREQLRLLGFTKKEVDATRRLQAIWKGRRERQNLHATLLGAKIMRNCESEYLKNPLDLRKMTHYLLYLHAMQEDVERARELYHHAIQRMQQRGPDDAWLLCSYAVFLAATGDDDWATIVELAEKGRHAREGPEGEDRQSYDLAKGGFFRSATAERPKSGWAWHNYALVLQLIYHDMSGAEDNYVRAILVDPHNKVLQDNFNSFLVERGSEMTCFDAIRNFSTNEMLRDLAVKKKQLDAIRQDPRMQEMVLKVQMAWRRRVFAKTVRERVIQANREDYETTGTEGVESAVDDETSYVSDAEKAVEGALTIAGHVRRWELGETPDGDVYFIDTLSGISQWNEPDDFEELISPKTDQTTLITVDDHSIPENIPTEALTLPGEYEAHWDSTSGRTFYYHIPSGTSSWDHPSKMSSLATFSVNGE